MFSDAMRNEKSPLVSYYGAIAGLQELGPEVVKVFIVLEHGHHPSDALTAEIQDHVRNRLSAHEYPREVAYIDEMPLTSTGKIIRRALRET